MKIARGPGQEAGDSRTTPFPVSAMKAATMKTMRMATLMITMTDSARPMSRLPRKLIAREGEHDNNCPHFGRQMNEGHCVRSKPCGVQRNGDDVAEVLEEVE